MIRAAGFVCPACLIAWECKSPIQPDGGEGLAKRKGIHCEMVSEGSVEQNRDLTDRNRIRGSQGRDERAKGREVPIHQGAGCKFGRCAGKAIGLTWGGLYRVP